MHWDRFFEDLEDQLDSEWEAERAALDSEAERLRLSTLSLRERLQGLCGGGTVGVEFADGTRLDGVLARVGRDWAALDDPLGRRAVVPLAAICAVAPGPEAVLRSARAPDAQRRTEPSGRPGLAERMGLGFVLRDLARRREPVQLRLHAGRMLEGTVDRALGDHLDLALHPLGTPRRAEEVQGIRLVPYAALAWVRIRVGTR